MKEAIKLIGALFGLAKHIFKEYRKGKDAKRKKSIREAAKENDLDKLSELILNRKPDDPE